MWLEHMLLATDLSEEARHSYGHASSLTKALKARLSVVHVDELSPLGLASAAEAGEFLATLASRRQARLEELGRDMEFLGVDFTLHLTEGQASQELLRVADEQGADLMILAKHGGGRGVRHLFMGSTSKRLVRHARVPVLVVPVPEDAPAHLAAPHTYRRLLAATDFSDDSNRGVQVAVELAEKLDAVLHVIHVVKVPSFVPGISEGWFEFPRERIDWIRRGHMNDLERIAEEHGKDRVVVDVVVGGGVPEALAHEAVTRDVDMIVIPTHGRGAIQKVLFGSTTERLLGLSTKPVMVLPKDFLRRPLS